MESDSGYKIIDPTINSGSNDDQSSGGGYSLFGTLGTGLEDERFESDNYKLSSGQPNKFMANVPTVASFSTDDTDMCGEGGCYSSARFELDTQSNPSDTLYLIEISDDNWTTVQCLDGDTHTPKPISNKDINDYLTQSAWETGSWSAANAVGLTSESTYQIRVRALNGDFTESEAGPEASASTYTPKIVFDLDIEGATGGTKNCVSGHVDNGDGTCTAAYSNPTEDGIVDPLYSKDTTTNSIEWYAYNLSIQVGYIEWDITDLQQIRNILSVALKYHGATDDGDTVGNITALTSQPSISSGNTIYAAINSGDVYINNWNPTVNTNQTISLGSEAITHLYSNILNNDYWFATGFLPTSPAFTPDSIYSEEYSSATPAPTLEITYTKSYPNTTWPYEIDLGEINTITPTTSQDYVWVYLGTNAVNGATVSVRDANDGLYSSETGQTISSQSADLSTANSGFGLKADTSHLYPSTGQPGYIKPTSTYNTAGTHEVGAISTTPSTIFCSILESGGDCTGGTPSPITQGRAAIWLKAKADMTTPIGTYSDLITFTTIGTF
jgi:hypothetical protein